MPGHVPAEERCQIRKCRREAAIVWLGIRLCDRHWSMQCDGKIDARRMRGR